MSSRPKSRELEAEIQKVAGHEFKVNSPQQLQVVLFDELGLTAVKKIKSGYSTDAASLEAIEDEHRIVSLILRYREIEKLRSTYGAPLIDAVEDDGRIHAMFTQVVARTGRLSSENPNLHNIPVRSLEGRRLRYAFVPTEGWLVAVSDYNQIELRILAHLSQDQGLLAAFDSHEDVHRTIAASVFGVASEEVTNEQRERAKAVSYGLVYGMEAFGLSRRLGIPVSAAQRDHEPSTSRAFRICASTSTTSSRRSASRASRAPSSVACDRSRTSRRPSAPSARPSSVRR